MFSRTSFMWLVLASATAMARPPGVESSGGSLAELAPQQAFQYNCHAEFKQQGTFEDPMVVTPADFVLSNDWTTHSQLLHYEGGNGSASYHVHLAFFNKGKDMAQSLALNLNSGDQDYTRSSGTSVPVDVLDSKMHAGISFSENKDIQRTHYYSINVDCVRVN